MYARYLRIFCQILLTVLLLVGCSDHDREEVAVEQQVDILSRFNAEGKAWMTLEIPLGNQTMTRTAFDDGTGDEYKVKDLYILIFAGTSESSAKFASAYKVVSPSFTMSPEEQITKKVTVPIDDANLNTGDKLYVLVLLNNNTSAITTTTFPATSVAFANGTTLTGGTSPVSALSAITIADYKDDGDYFLMTNAPLASANDGTGTVSTLVEVPATYFFPTQALAEANPGGHIYVERAAAKVTVTESVSPKKILGNPNIEFATSDIKFALYNFNDQSRLVRHFNPTWLTYNSTVKRFVETAALPSGKYRTYWAEDLNYNGREGLHTIRGWNEMSQSYCCAENTFTTTAMTDENTTSVVVRIRLNNGGDFYTASTTGRDIVYLPPANSITEEGTSASSSFSRRQSPAFSANTRTIDEYLREWLWQTNAGFRSWVNTYAARDPRHVQITVYQDERTENGSGRADAQVTAVTQTARTSGDGVTAFTALNLVNYFNANIKIDYYWHGYTFYRVPIRHFDDTQTPWTSAATMTGNGADQAYGSNDTDYLGRYGMVRNNWYTVNVRSVTHVGAPVIPPLTTDADDKVEQLLNATLTINSWTTNNQTLGNP